MMLARLCLVALLASGGSPLPDGAPTSVCDSMAPVHPETAVQTSRSAFAVVPDHLRVGEGRATSLTISSSGPPFEGFLLQARSPAGKRLGRFAVSGNLVQTMDCDNPADSITHTDTTPKMRITVQWTPPPGYLGPVIFNSTIAEDYRKYWIGLQAAPIRVVRSSELTPEDLVNRVDSASSTVPTFIKEQQTDAANEKLNFFYDGCFREKGCFGVPEGCIHTKNCKAAMAYIVKGNTYEYEILSAPGAKWAATALSFDNQMGDDSVMECVREDSGDIKTYMSWTKGKSGAFRDASIRNALTTREVKDIDGSLYCRVERALHTTINGREFDLVKGKFHLLVGAGSNLKENAVGYHTIAFLASGESTSMSDVSEIGAASKLLLRLHGAFMIVAWIGTASVGIILARYFRQTWVGSQMCGKDIWFAWHRVFMVATWSLTVAAFIIIFVELGEWSQADNPHAILGCVTTVICFLQPIGAYFRPHPGTSKRPIFNWMHWLAGNSAHILAIVTIFFAVKLPKAELPEDTTDYILVAFVVFHVAMNVILSILGCVNDRVGDERAPDSFQMKDMAPGSSNGRGGSAKMDAPQSGFRRFLLAVYLLVAIVFVAALVVIAVLAPIEETVDKVMKQIMKH